jgi:hypothetical protein
MEFAYDGGGLGKGGTATLYLDGASVGEGRIDATVPMMFSADETTDVGTDGGTPVSDDLDLRASRFTGRVRWVELDLGDDAQDADHLITPEERLSIAMAVNRNRSGLAANIPPPHPKRVMSAHPDAHTVMTCPVSPPPRSPTTTSSTCSPSSRAPTAWS